MSDFDLPYVGAVVLVYRDDPYGRSMAAQPGFVKKVDNDDGEVVVTVPAEYNSVQDVTCFKHISQTDDTTCTPYWSWPRPPLQSAQPVEARVLEVDGEKRLDHTYVKLSDVVFELEQMARECASQPDSEPDLNRSDKVWYEGRTRGFRDAALVLPERLRNFTVSAEEAPSGGNNTIFIRRKR